MKKRLTALVMALAMMFALGANAVSADDEPADTAAEAAEAAETAETTETAEEAEAAAEDEPEAEEAAEPAETAPKPDAEGTLSFANVGGRMKENYYPLLALKESIDDVESHDYEWREENLRLRLNEIASMQWGLMEQYGAAGSQAASAMQPQYAAFREQFDDLRDGTTRKDDADALRQYHNGENLAVIGGESLYIQIKELQAQDAAITRGLAQMDRAIRELELRQELGQISALTVEQMKITRAQTVSRQQTLRTGVDALLLTLKSMVGAELDEPLTLGALPKVTAAQLAAMDLEADLAKAKEASYELYDGKKQIEDFREGGYHDVISAFGSSDKIFEVSQVKHALKAMQISYEDTVLTYELNFRTLYAQVKDAAQVLETRRAVLASQEKEYAVSALKYEQGNISANALSDAKDDLAAAKDDVSAAERDLFSKYHAYQWAVEYGILNV
ncbi:MAG: TolC family protein [Oscillospiraceae bacterium]|nr:TolC family protein [Oscillospiraceae bacterium]